jgi:hypothetical protein
VRARLLVILTVLLGLLTAGLGVPLALANAQAEQSRMFTDRLTDTVFYASLAERSVTEADAAGLTAELARYDEVYGVEVLVLDCGRWRARAGPRPCSTGPPWSGSSWPWPGAARRCTR